MLNCTIPEKSWFSRKIYYYPDNSKSVQITQYESPVGKGGVYYLNGKKPIRITEIHLEEDPGSTKRTADNSSLLDYNRSGIPLAEIVTEPDIANPAEAREFLNQLVADIKHTLEIDTDSERSIRCDCNISVGQERVEVKNVTGLKNAERALTFELIRQTKLIKSGGKIERETRHFDEARGVTLPLRKKEFASDYGYMDEPDLGMFYAAEMAKDINIRESPMVLTVRLAKDYEIPDKLAKQLVSTSMDLAMLFEEIANATDSKTALSISTGVVSANWKVFVTKDKETAPIVESAVKLFKGEINDIECSMAIKAYMTDTDMEAVKNVSGNLEELINKYLDEHPEIVEDAKKNEKAGNRVIGYVMKETGGAYSSSDIVGTTKKLLEARF